MDRNDFIDKILGGIFGVIAVIAAMIEAYINGISSATVASAVKDIFGTLTVIVLFFAVIREKIPSRNFRKTFEREMEVIEKNYSPLIYKFIPSKTEKKEIKQKNESTIRYEMLTSVENLFENKGKDHFRIFEMDAEKPTEILFFVREKFFGSGDYNPQKISSDINLHLTKKFPQYTVEHNDDSVTVKFNKELKTNEEAKELISLIDTTVMLFIAKNKKV